LFDNPLPVELAVIYDPLCSTTSLLENRGVLQPMQTYNYLANPPSLWLI